MRSVRYALKVVGVLLLMAIVIGTNVCADYVRGWIWAKALKDAEE